MKQLLREGFRRLSGRSDQAVFVLSQAMGGGKTHSMIALGLLARHPDLRQKVMGTFTKPAIGSARRASSPLPGGIRYPVGRLGRSRGTTRQKGALQRLLLAHAGSRPKRLINLLKGEPTVILLDELPPYFENARAKPIGNSDLAHVTATALSNLLVAVSKKELSNVCVVISDLKATYQAAATILNQALNDFQNEAGRGALPLHPVALKHNELYHILRTRLFTDRPAEASIQESARPTLRPSKMQSSMDITNGVARGVCPAALRFLALPFFHPRSLRPLPRESRFSADARSHSVSCGWSSPSSGPAVAQPRRASSIRTTSISITRHPPGAPGGQSHPR